MLLKSAAFVDNLYHGLIYSTENDYILYAPYKELIRNIINYNQDMSDLYGEAFSSPLLDDALKHLEYTYNMLLDSFRFADKIYQNTIVPSKEDYIKYTPYQKLITENISYLKNRFGVSKSPGFVSKVLKNLSIINSETRENSAKKVRKNLVEDTKETSWVERVSRGNMEQNSERAI